MIVVTTSTAMMATQVDGALVVRGTSMRGCMTGEDVVVPSTWASRSENRLVCRGRRRHKECMPALIRSLPLDKGCLCV